MTIPGRWLVKSGCTHSALVVFTGREKPPGTSRQPLHGAIEQQFRGSRHCFGETVAVARRERSGSTAHIIAFKERTEAAFQYTRQ
jgi:hypothetical protein